MCQHSGDAGCGVLSVNYVSEKDQTGGVKLPQRLQPSLCWEEG